MNFNTNKLKTPMKSIFLPTFRCKNTLNYNNNNSVLFKSLRLFLSLLRKYNTRSRIICVNLSYFNNFNNRILARIAT